MKNKVVMSWSGGKDSSLALYHLLKSEKYEVVSLMTTVYEPHKRVSMHGIHESLLEAQAEAIGIPLVKVYLNEKTHEAYEEAMKGHLLAFKEQGVNNVAFGDIFLEDLRKYREERLEEVGMNAVFPLWNIPTVLLAKEFITEGFLTHICSVDDSLLEKEHVGVRYDSDFLASLPESVDPCGENGEFHSFCYDGPIFKNRVRFVRNGIVEKTYETKDKLYRYWFSDISLPQLEKVKS